MKEMTAHDRFLERQRIANERALEMYGKVIEDALVGGTGIMKDGKRIDPASIYSDIVSDGGMDPRNQFDKPAPVAHPVIAGALFDFMGWLTSRKKTLILSSADNASPAVEAITEFAKMRGLSLDGARVQDWQDIAPKQDVPETNFGNMAEPKIGCVNHDCDQCKAQPAPVQDSTCNETLRVQGKAYPRTCKKCGLGPCVGKPKSVTTPPAPQPVPVKTYHDGKPWPVQPKPWMGLTEEEVMQTMSGDWTSQFYFARAIEAKLKEKNT